MVRFTPNPFQYINKSNYYISPRSDRKAFQPLVDVFTVLYTFRSSTCLHEAATVTAMATTSSCLVAMAHLGGGHRVDG